MTKRMMNTLTIAAIVILFACSDDNTTAPDESDDSALNTSIQPVPVTLSGCYSSTTGRDSATLTLEVADSVVTGKLDYNRFEKDDNRGDLRGVIRGNHVVADYTFTSEGKRSVRELILLIKGDSLLEVYGEIVVSGDSARFKNPATIEYMPQAFVKVACK